MSLTADRVGVTKSSLRLLHYGAGCYDPNKFRPISDRKWVKPYGGLWTSPVNSEYGWKQWCEDECFGDLGTSFEVNFSGNVLKINGAEDLEKLTWVEIHEYFQFPLFEPLVLIGFDAIHLTVRGQEKTRFSSPRNLYGWDCESVLVMNASCLS